MDLRVKKITVAAAWEMGWRRARVEAGRPFKRKRLWHSSKCELMEDFGLHHKASSLGAFRT